LVLHIHYSLLQISTKKVTVSIGFRLDTFLQDESSFEIIFNWQGFVKEKKKFFSKKEKFYLKTKEILVILSIYLPCISF